MPDLKRLQALIERIDAMSRNDTVPWTETSAEAAFQASVNQYTVTIEKEYLGRDWGEDVYGYVFRIQDSEGKLLDEVRPRDFPQSTPFGRHERADDALRDLYDRARRKALHVDKQLDDLLASLDRLQ